MEGEWAGMVPVQYNERPISSSAVLCMSKTRVPAGTILFIGQGTSSKIRLCLLSNPIFCWFLRCSYCYYYYWFLTPHLPQKRQAEKVKAEYKTIIQNGRNLDDTSEFRECDRSLFHCIQMSYID